MRKPNQDVTFCKQKMSLEVHLKQLQMLLFHQWPTFLDHDVVEAEVITTPHNEVCGEFRQLVTTRTIRTAADEELLGVKTGAAVCRIS
jgi:hypothetical protein